MKQVTPHHTIDLCVFNWNAPALGIILGLLISMVRTACASDPAEQDLARTILQDQRMDDVLRMGRGLLASGMAAGGHYEEIWIRDLNTFIVPLLDETPRESVRDALLIFFHFQGDDGNIVDGYVPKERGSERYKYRFTSSKPALKAHKNTVETDQESSLVQAVCRYVQKTKDTTIIDEMV